MKICRFSLPGALVGLAVTTGALIAAPPAEQAPRGNEPMSPTESHKKLVISPELDLQVDLVANEPEVIDPVAIAFDERGRMFVVEMRDYPNGPAEGQPPMSRIRLLEDTDGNGQFDTAHVFVDNLLFATGVMPWKEGIIVTLAGEVRYLKDTDGDNAADVNEVWFSGFEQENPQLRANHPTLGPDGWIYIANGLRGGTVKTVHPDWSNPELNLRDGDFRFDPHTGKAEVITGNGQFGLTFDDWGNRFICSNRNPCDQIMFERYELERNPALAAGRPIQEVVAAGNDSRVYALINAWTTSTLHAGQFTAACGVKIYTGNALPAECYGNVFTCEPTGSLVHRETVAPAGGTFQGTPGEKEAEFLASTDDWFKPVNIANGPDGALYIVDMYRAVIEHPQWMPEELRNRRDLRWGDESGRIYRVAAQGKAPGKLPTLDRNDIAGLIKTLESDNGWLRDTATRLLCEQFDQWNADDLMAVAQSAKVPASRLRAIQLAVAHPEGDPTEILLVGLKDADPMVVAGSADVAGHLIRTERGDKAAIGARLLELSASDSSPIRFEVARNLGLLDAGEDVTKALATIAAKDAGDRWTRVAVLISMNDPLSLYSETVKLNADGSVPFLADLAEVIGRRRNDAEIKQLLTQLSTTGPEAGWSTPILLGLGRGIGGSLEKYLALLDEPVRGRFNAFFSAAAKTASDETADASLRQNLISIVALGERSHALPVLLDLMDEVRNPTVRVTVAQALGRFRGDERIAEVLLDDFGARPPLVRSASLDAILADPARAITLLQAVEAKDVSVAELGATRINALSKHGDANVRELAKKLFAPPADRQAVLEAYASAATMNGNSDRGRIVFEKNCATCHRIGNIGTQVGPDIADSRTRTPEALLTDILDPNRAIDGRYLSYSVLLVDGTVQTGLITSETGATVTLEQPEGKTLSIARDQIDQMYSDGTSLMPVGIERTITPEEMGDLISFIKNWRYLDGAVPLGDAAK